MQEVKPFKIRCSAIGKIMTMPRSKADREAGKISKGAQTYVKEWYMSQLYDRRKDFTSKYTAKGIYTEDEAIKFLSKMDGVLYLKNDVHLHSQHLTGTPDIVTADEIVEIKNSWDPFSFPILETECPNKDYIYQVQGYMALTGRQKARIVYVLSNAPEYLIDQAANRERYTMDMPEVTEELYNKHYNAMTFDDIPDKLRIKTFTIERDEAVIDQIRERVEACRNYLETIKIKA